MMVAVASLRISSDRLSSRLKRFSGKRRLRSWFKSEAHLAPLA